MSEAAQAGAAQATTPATAQTTTEGAQTGPFPFEGVSPDLKALFEAKGWKTVDDVGKSYANLEKTIGERVLMPKEGDEAGRKALAAKLGYGAPAEGKYELKIAEGVTVDEGLKGGFEKIAGEIDLSSKQAQRLLDWNNELAKGQQAAAVKEAEAKANAKDTALEALKTELGPDKFEADLTLATKAATYGGFPDDLLNRLEDVMGTKTFVQCMARIGALGNEDQFVDGQGAAPRDAPKPLENRLWPNLT